MCMRIKITIVVLLLLFMIGGCATTPAFDTNGINRQLSPTQAADSASNSVGQRIIWGGMILSSVNLAEATQIEVLAYPLNNNHRPDPNASPLGRFLLRKDGYLETREFAEGRYISVQGHIVKTQQGKIGEKQYLYPVVESEQIFLWPKNLQETEPSIHFGFGVMLSN